MAPDEVEARKVLAILSLTETERSLYQKLAGSRVPLRLLNPLPENTDLGRALEYLTSSGLLTYEYCQKFHTYRLTHRNALTTL